jgi:hypothetical protein
MSPTPVLQAVAMVEVTEEMQKCSLDLWVSKTHNAFRHFYGNLVANTIQDITGVCGEY